MYKLFFAQVTYEAILTVYFPINSEAYATTEHRNPKLSLPICAIINYCNVTLDRDS